MTESVVDSASDGYMIQQSNQFRYDYPEVDAAIKRLSTSSIEGFTSAKPWLLLKIPTSGGSRSANPSASYVPPSGAANFKFTR